MPSVTVLMSVYNGERYLSEAVDSVLHQTFTDFEFIIVNDGSTDDTTAILASYDDPRIVLVQNETNLGLTRSLNRGLGLAGGSYLARQDADDVSLPERLGSQVAFLTANPQTCLVGSSIMVVNSASEAITRMILPTSNRELQSLLLKRNPFCHGSVMLRKSSVQQVGGYREAFSRAQDYDLWLRLAEIGLVANLPTVLYQWRFTPEAVSVRHRREQMAYDALARQCAIHRRRGLPEPSRETLHPVKHQRLLLPVVWETRRIQADYYFRWGKAALVQQEQPTVARRHLNRSLRIWLAQPAALFWWVLTWLPIEVIQYLRALKRLGFCALAT
jgi:glycosyltransferase involved in cell wall biosynthesis